MERKVVAEQDIETRYRVRDHEVAAKCFEDEVIILNLSTAKYYAAEGIGAWIWSTLTGGHAPSRVVDHLAKALGMNAATLSSDVTPFIDSLVDEGLIEPDPKAPSAAVEPIDTITIATNAYTPPLLEAYGDMTELLAIDPPMPEADTSNSIE